MNTFFVCESPTEKFSAIVIATGSSAPQDDLPLVATALRKKQVAGMIVFDLLTANGTRSRRFFCKHFDGKTFSEGRFQRLEGDDILKRCSAEFFSQHLNEVDLSMLSPALQSAVRCGQAV